ncbi:MAG TPA: tetratricopeptide repeat protein [Bryobacteraceae bacterium]|nr:tetratricopeptide repeat protein [Bryobacteraceae bacterium]
MSRCWIGIVFAGVVLAQQTPPAQPLPPDEDAGQKSKQTTGAKPSATTELPPDEDAPANQDKYSFNPVKSKRAVSVGAFYFKKGDFKAASARFLEATQWNAGNAEAWLKLGEAEERRENPKAARAAYEHYLKLSPDAKNASEVRKRIEKLKG